MSRHDVAWLDLLQSRNGRWDQRQKQGSGQVKTAHDGIDPLHASQGLGVMDDIDNPRMPTTGHDHQALAPYIDNCALIVANQWIGFPLPMPQGLMHRESLLKRGRPRHFSRYQQHVIYEHGWTNIFDDFNILTAQIGELRSGQTHSGAVG